MSGLNRYTVVGTYSDSTDDDGAPQRYAGYFWAETWQDAEKQARYQAGDSLVVAAVIGGEATVEDAPNLKPEPEPETEETGEMACPHCGYVGEMHADYLEAVWQTVSGAIDQYDYTGVTGTYDDGSTSDECLRCPNCSSEVAIFGTHHFMPVTEGMFLVHAEAKSEVADVTYIAFAVRAGTVEEARHRAGLVLTSPTRWKGVFAKLRRL